MHRAAGWVMRPISLIRRDGPADTGDVRLRVVPVAFTTLVGLLLPTIGGAQAADAAQTASAVWRPQARATWQWQLTGKVDQSVNAAVYDIDLFDNDARVVASLHAKGRKVICYMSAGSWEDWRPDAAAFPAAVKGRSNGWPGERWLDIRRLDLLAPILNARLDLCKAKGFDAVEPDNVDGYTNVSGFPLTSDDQLRFNRWLADAAHARGLGIGLKNDVEQVPALVTHFDFAVNESCVTYNECRTLTPFVAAGKAVFHVEYGKKTTFCAQTKALGLSSMIKRSDLGAYRQPCP